jgi:hypothetical protein
LFLWKRISQFIAATFPDAATTIDFERNLQAEALFISPNFATTNAVIAELSKYHDFNDSQCRRIIEALIENSQVRWIKDDDDVKGFFTSFIDAHQHQIEADLLDKATSILKKQ